MTRDQQLQLIRQKCIETKPEIEHSQDGFNGLRPIRLADVLLAIYAYDNLRTDGMTYFLRLHAELNGDLMLQDGPFGEWSRRATWNLRQDDLTAQSDACIQFLWELLS